MGSRVVALLLVTSPAVGSIVHIEHWQT